MKRSKLKSFCKWSMFGIIFTLFSMFAMAALAEDTADKPLIVEYNDVADVGETPEEKTGYVFAGYFSSDEVMDSTTALSSDYTSGKVYAKYVPEEILGVRVQVSSKLWNTDTTDDETGAIRFVTSVDTKDYSEVGFIINIGGKDNYKANKYIYKTLYTEVGDINSPKTEDYIPSQIFHKNSVYFKTWSVTDIDALKYLLDFKVTAYWKTLDGTLVKGETRTVNVNQFRSWEYVFVDDSGSDETGVGTSKAPYATLDRALRAMKDYRTQIGKLPSTDETEGADGMICIGSNIVAASDFGWTDHDMDVIITSNVKDISDLGTLVNASKLDFSNVADFGVNDAVTFTNMTLVLPEDVTVNGNRFKINEDVIANKNILHIIPDAENQASVEINGEEVHYTTVASDYILSEISDAEPCKVAVTFSKLDQNKDISGYEAYIENGGYYTAIEKAIAVAVMDADVPVVSLLKDATVESPFVIDKSVHITGQSNSENKNKITINSTTSNLFDLNKGGNLTLNNLNLVGSKNAVNNIGGTVTATDVTIEGIEYCGFYIDSEGYAKLTNVTVTGGNRGIQLYNGGAVEGNVVKIDSSTSYGIASGSGSRFEITDLTVSGSKNHAMNVYGGSTAKVITGKVINPGAQGVNVEASTVTLNHVDIIFNVGRTDKMQGVKAYSKATVTLNDVNIENASQHGIQIWSKSNVTGNKVTITSPKECGVICGDAETGFNIIDLTVTNCGTFALNVYTSAAGTVTNGTITNPGKHGANVDGSATLTLNRVGITFDAGRSGDFDGVYLQKTSTANLQDVSVTKAPRHGVWVNGAGTKATVTGTLMIDSVGQRGLYNSSGNVNAETATVNITDSGSYGVSTNGTAGKTTIGVLNVTRAKGSCAVTANGSGTVVTINGGSVVNSAKVGINAAGGTTVNLADCKIENSGTYDIQTEAANATMNLQNVIYSTKNSKGTINE